MKTSGIQWIVLIIILLIQIFFHNECRQESVDFRKQLARHQELCNEIAFPNTQARPEGFDIGKHLDKLEEARKKIALEFDTEQGLDFIENALVHTHDETAAACVLKILSTMKRKRAGEIIRKYHINKTNPKTAL